MQLHETAAQVQIKEAVMNHIRQRPGFILVEGDPGSGKSTIKSALIKSLRNQVLVVELNYSRYSFSELIFTLAEKLKLKATSSIDQDAAETQSEEALSSCLQTLTHFCRRKAQSGIPLAVIIDDAQYLPLDTLEALKAVVTDATNPLALHGVLISDRSLKPRLELSFLWESLVHTSMSIPRPSEAEMQGFINHLLAVDYPQLRIDENAEMDIVMGSAGNFRKAKQLLQHAATLCQQSGSKLIDDGMVNTAVGDNEAIPVLENHDDTDQSRHSIPESLQGILNRSLLDTPDRPTLKQKSSNADIPLFVNDLGHETVSPFEQPTKTASEPVSAVTTSAFSTTPKSSSSANEPLAPVASSDDKAEKSQSHQQKSQDPAKQAQPKNQEGDESLDSVAVKPASIPPATEKAEETTTPPHQEEPSFTATRTDSLTESPNALTATNPLTAPTTSVKDKATSETPHSSSGWKWLLALLLAGLLATLAWLSTQPGFAPEAKIDQLKQLFNQTLEQVLPSTQNSGNDSSVDSNSNDNSSGKNSSDTSLLMSESSSTQPTSATLEKTESTTADTQASASAESTAPVTSTTRATIAPTLFEPAPTKQETVDSATDSETAKLELIEPEPRDPQLMTPESNTPESTNIIPASLANPEQANAISTSESPTIQNNEEQASELAALVNDVERRLEELPDDVSTLTEQAVNQLAKAEAVNTKKVTEEASPKATSTESALPTQRENTAVTSPHFSSENLSSQKLSSQTLSSENRVTTDPEAAAAIESIQEMLDAEAKNAQLAMLRKKAQIHLDNYRYTIPESDNAVLTLRRIQDLDAADNWSQEQLNWIKQQYLRRAQSAEKQGNYIVAAQNYGRLLWIAPEDPEIQSAVSRLSKTQR